MAVYSSVDWSKGGEDESETEKRKMQHTRKSLELVTEGSSARHILSGKRPHSIK